MQIVFVADHGHGASSVLQSMLGLRFMPGAGARRVFDPRKDMILPRPLEVTVHHTDEPYAYARLPDSPGVRPSIRAPRQRNFQVVADMLADLHVEFPAEPEGDTGVYYGELADPTTLYIDIFSPDLPDMHFVQLPGLCRVRGCALLLLQGLHACVFVAEHTSEQH